VVCVCVSVRRVVGQATETTTMLPENGIQRSMKRDSRTENTGDEQQTQGDYVFSLRA